MSVVPRERAGMASGISTTSRFSGILLGFATLSGVLATSVRATLTSGSCEDIEACARMRALADAVVAGDSMPSAAWEAPNSAWRPPRRGSPIPEALRLRF